jgi:ornithine cyclodeaminase
MIDAVDAVEAAFRHPEIGAGDPLRTVVGVDHGQVLLMPGLGTDLVGVKIVGVAPGNADRGLPRIQGVYVLMDATTLTPVAVLDAVALTSLRTPATSAVSIRHAATADASHLVVFGTGPQARGHIEAMAAVRPLRTVGVVGRRHEAVEEVLAEVAAAGLEGYAAGAGDIADADVVCLCTSASEPLIDGSLLRPWAHVVAVGSHLPTMREVDTVTVRRSAVIVETRDAALAEAGDLIIPIAEGVFDGSGIDADLHELVTGQGPDPGRVTFYKSVGIAAEDLAVARLAHSRSTPHR